ncbi:MAG: S-layer homology domain-containing protein [Symbiobacteriaceae bacterium]|nr:S-layer homology domain-containing protein [Symbiobacteriaceae bacterium]
MLRLYRFAAWLLIIALAQLSVAGNLLASLTNPYSFLNPIYIIPLDPDVDIPVSPPKQDTFLVQDTFVGAKAQLKPIADFFLAQNWYYWVGQDLAGKNTTRLIQVFGFRAGDVWHSERVRRGSLRSIEDLTDDRGVPLGSDATIMDILNSPQVKPELLKAVQAAFPDIRGDEWYAGMVALAVMMGVVSGKPNPEGEGMVFAGDDYLTRAEWVVMLNRCHGLQDWLYMMDKPEAKLPSKDGVVPLGTWFLGDYNQRMPYQFGGMYSLEELSQPATRAEAAAMLAVGSGFSYHHMKSYGYEWHDEDYANYREWFTDTQDMWLNPPMVDLLNTGIPKPLAYLGGYLTEGQTIPQRLAAAQRGEADFPYPIYRSLMFNVCARVIGGFPDGTLRPYDYLTRAQGLAILFKLYDMYPQSVFADPNDRDR